MDLLISYRDSEGIVSIRHIADIKSIDGITFDAFCMLRKEIRTFKIGNILDAANPITGEVINNIWEYLGVNKNEYGNVKIISLVNGILAEIMALKYFCLQVRQHRGFAKKERRHILDFIQRNSSIPVERHSELEEWLIKLWVGDMYKNPDPMYVESLKRISPNRIFDCRQAALAIAAGSGRRLIAPEILDRIEREFTIAV